LAYQDAFKYCKLFDVELNERGQVYNYWITLFEARLRQRITVRLDFHLRQRACPELEMLAVYLEHNLTENQTRKIEGHLVECRLCRKTVINTFRSQKFVSDPALHEVKKL
jgi:hypothetical protein